MEVVKRGFVENITFRNEENGYTVMTLSVAKGEEELTCVGSFPFLSLGDYIEVNGEEITHPLYGEQLKVTSYIHMEPEDTESMERYLGSGAIKGVGKTLASRVIKKFGEKTFEIIGNEPERLAEVKGISMRLAGEIQKQFYEKQEMRQAMMTLQKYGITGSLAAKIYTFYGQRMYRVLRENPYKIAEDINRIGFKTTDEIARRVGFDRNSDFRIRAGILYVLSGAVANGHVFLPREEILSISAQLLEVDVSDARVVLDNLLAEGKVLLKTVDMCKEAVYNPQYYYMELNTARKLTDLSLHRFPVDAGKTRDYMAHMEKRLGITLDEMQRKAVTEAAGNGVFILTGGPGTGKTTTINAIIDYFELTGAEILLAAPTGRAAKRMTETTGREARTIHRLLELVNGGDTDGGSYVFNRNEDYPLEADVVIIDEMSMVDIFLMNALLKAIPVGTRLVLVGDVNQLPSVGPGNVLKDIIRADAFPIVRLSKIFRQAEQSAIVVNAHAINHGEHPDLAKKTPDFFFLQRSTSEEVLDVVTALVKDKLPKNVGAVSQQIQVLTPMKKGELGVENLNRVLQAALNPPAYGKQEREAHGVVFREGDKVMQIKNDYQLEWEIVNRYNIVKESGTGVFNGDMGIISEINTFGEYVRVLFDDERYVNYTFSALDELELAYAVTVHKSQGSEYPAVVMPILSGPKLLFHRNILYTAVTRAKKCVALIGSASTIDTMIDNERENLRNTGLSEAIRDMIGI